MTGKTLPHTDSATIPTGFGPASGHVNPTEPITADTSRHSKLNRKRGYHLPHEARSTPAT